MPKQSSESDVSGQYKDFFDQLRFYWGIYGGWPGFVRSPYLHLSLILLVLTTRSWLYGEWWTDVLTVGPSLLGFTLAGFAVFLGFGDTNFLGVISGNRTDQKSAQSPYMALSASFLHFVLLQILSLIFALAARSLHFDLPCPELQQYMVWLGGFGDLIGYWFFLYSLTTALAAGVAIFRLSKWYDDYQTAMLNSSNRDE